jgi:hypothetical protein
MAAEAMVAGAGRVHRRAGWLRTIFAVLGCSFVAGAGCLVALLGLSALHLVPYGGDAPDAGWPWHIDGVWAAAADLGPTLAVSFAFAALTSAYLAQYTGVRSVRWPLVLVAATVGWLPLTGERHGLIIVNGGSALIAVVFAARWWSSLPRRRIPSSRPLAAAVALGAVALVAASLSYGALHPLAASHTDGTAAVTLHQGRSQRIRFEVENRGPLTARVQHIAIVVDPQLAGLPVRIASAEIENGRRTAPTPAGLFEPWRPQRLSPGESAPVYLTLSVAACRRHDTNVDLLVRALDIRLRTTFGGARTQRVRLEHDMRVRCRATGS